VHEPVPDVKDTEKPETAHTAVSLLWSETVPVSPEVREYVTPYDEP
jgi:hypothetical protein